MSGRLAAVLAGLALVPAAASAQVSIRTVYDFAAGKIANGPEYGGVALNPAGTELWWADSDFYAAVKLDGTVRFTGPLPLRGIGSIEFGSLSFDSAGYAWGVSQNENFTGTIFRISDKGKAVAVSTIPDGLVAGTGLAYAAGTLYGVGFVLGAGYELPYSFNIGTRKRVVLSPGLQNTNNACGGKPAVSGSLVYFCSGRDKYSSAHYYLGEYALDRYDTATKQSTFLGFQVDDETVDPYGLDGSPAVDASGNAYFVALNPGLPGFDTVNRTTPSGATTVLATFPTPDRSYNLWAGLAHDAAHDRIYGAYSSYGIDASNPGTVFCYNPSAGTFVNIYTFSGPDGEWPIGDLAISADGTKLYGATRGSGSGAGLFYELSLGPTPPC